MKAAGKSEFHRAPVAIMLACLLIAGCHSLPPFTPSTGPDIRFVPQVATWTEVGAVPEIRGDWYKQGALSLTVYPDSLIVEGITAEYWTVDNSDSFYRIIYRIDSTYYALYINRLSSDSLTVAYINENASDPTQAALLNLIINFWQVLTANIPWKPMIVLPNDIYGNWHVEPGVLEISIGTQAVYIDGLVWDIESISTNYHVYRIILSRDGAGQTLFVRNAESDLMDVLLYSSTDDIQDRFGEIPGVWTTVVRWF